MANMSGPHGRMKGGRGAKNPMKTLGRLLRYTFTRNKFATACVVVFVLLASVANVLSASRVSIIVTELINGKNADMSVIYQNILFMGCVYFIGAASSFAYNIIMMYIAQGTLKKMRNDMFAKMQTLPLRYFDSHTHGDLMSLYTNDVDTMRQLLTQTIPQLISSAITLIAILVFMIMYSVTLMLVGFVVLGGIVVATKIIGGKSAKYYLYNQQALGKLNGYVEEMTEGQKVIKVFCHEQKARDQFKVVNDQLNEAGSKANAYAFVMGPINNNLGYLQYVLIALVGVLIIGLGSEVGLLSIFCSVQNAGSANRVAVMAGMLVSFAGCCSPVPGDDIVGFVTRGRGVVVHRRDCPNMKNAEPGRLLRAEWTAQEGAARFKASIVVLAEEQGAALSAISASVSEMKLEISSINGRYDKNNSAIVEVSVSLTNRQDVEVLIGKIRQHPKILDVHRMAN